MSAITLFFTSELDIKNRITFARRHTLATTASMTAKRRCKIVQRKVDNAENIMEMLVWLNDCVCGSWDSTLKHHHHHLVVCSE